MSNRAFRRLLFTSLYFSEGAPVGYLWWTLPTLMRSRGIAVAEITSLTSVLVLPWAFKFLWAPIIDSWQTPRWTLRSWILIAQLAMGLSIIPLFALDFSEDFPLVFAFLVIHAFSAATQDAAVDALAIRTVPSEERGRLNGWMQAGMLAGRGLLGGGALVLVEFVGDRIIFVILLLAIWSPMMMLLSHGNLRDGGNLRSPGNKPGLLEKMRHAFLRRRILAGLLFALVAGACFEGAGALAGPLLVDRNLTGSQIGLFFGVIVIGSMIGGSLLGGILADRWGKARATGIFLLFLSAMILFLSLILALSTAAESGFIVFVLAVVYFGIGLFTAASYSMFMDLADPSVAATQFSAFMGATNGCEAWATFSAGQITGYFGYPVAFALLSVASLLSVPLLGLTRGHGGEICPKEIENCGV